MRYSRENSPGYLINRAGRLFIKAIERRLCGGSAGPMPVFVALRDGRTMTQRDLAIDAAVEQPTMANTLARMERDGLIVRTPDSRDGRSALISLTPLGRERADQAMEAGQSVNAMAMSDLTEDERRQLLALLHRVVAVLEAETAESPARKQSG